MTLVVPEVRDARRGDLAGIVAVDAAITGEAKPAYWQRILEAYGGAPKDRVALVAVDDAGEIVGHLFGEVRAWEFGSAPCGWVFSIGVQPRRARKGTATELCRHALARFHDLGVDVIRTMVRRGDVPVLAFFRSQGFVGGPFSEMERRIDRRDALGTDAP